MDNLSLIPGKYSDSSFYTQWGYHSLPPPLALTPLQLFWHITHEKILSRHLIWAPWPVYRQFYHKSQESIQIQLSARNGTATHSRLRSNSSSLYQIHGLNPNYKSRLPLTTFNNRNGTIYRCSLSGYGYTSLSIWHTNNRLEYPSSTPKNSSTCYFPFFFSFPL